MHRLALVRRAALALAPVFPLFGLLAQATLAATAGATPPAGTAAGPRVQIKGFAFDPPVLTVTAGTTVTWVNADDDPHTVKAADRSFGSAALDTGASWAFTFARPGDYGYFCSLHPHMTGRVVVRPS